MLKAVVYDFDGTLTPTTLPEFKILEASGMPGGAKNPDFFAKAHALADSEKINVYEAMIRVILNTVKQGGFKLTNKNIALGADERVFNPGVEEFLTNLRQKGVANYLLSSGAKAYLERLKIAPEFTEIYASVLTYDQNDEANGVERVMSEEEKAVALTEIATKVNGDRHDFTGIIYIGDGPTDVKAMQFIKAHGGKAILIQHDVSDWDLPVAELGQIDLTTGPDFSRNSELTNYINSLIAAE